jgi:hypothetical protein
MKSLPLLLLFLMLCPRAVGRPPGTELRDGRLLVNGQWTFLKVAKPLRYFSVAKAVDQLIADLPTLKHKHYNCIEINCYWHMFDHDGDGAPDESLEPLRKLIDAIAQRGMYPCLSVETYGVGGGQIPGGFWKAHSDAIAIDSDGKEVKDDEYGVMSAVPSLFSPAYLEASRNYIRNLTRGIPHEKILYFETTVEPQYMGNHALDFSPHAAAAWQAWLNDNHLADPARTINSSRPYLSPDENRDGSYFSSAARREALVKDPTWNRFRAEHLADWINGDAQAYRDVAGKDAWIAVDYLETCGPDMRNRNGDSDVFLAHLTAPNIIQVNWHWNATKHAPNQCAYDHVRKAMREQKRNWAITEHMTINGTDYSVKDMPALLRNTIRQSTNLGWEFVDVGASNAGFSLYNPDWSPKPTMKVVDDSWDQWMAEIKARK